MANAAGKYNPIITRGASWRPVITWWTKNLETEVLTNVDLTGCVVRAQFRKKVGDPALLDLSTTNGKITIATVVIEAQTIYKIYPVLSAAETATLPANVTSGIFALDVVHPDGTVTPLLDGIFMAVARKIVPA